MTIIVITFIALVVIVLVGIGLAVLGEIHENECKRRSLKR